MYLNGNYYITTSNIGVSNNSNNVYSMYCILPLTKQQNKKQDKDKHC